MPTLPTGGNMDLTDAAPGSTVYLPVQVPGALLSIGDIHAVMASQHDLVDVLGCFTPKIVRMDGA